MVALLSEAKGKANLHMGLNHSTKVALFIEWLIENVIFKNKNFWILPSQSRLKALNTVLDIFLTLVKNRQKIR